MMKAKDFRSRSVDYAYSNPVKFAALCSFCTLGAVPVLAFLVYSVATLIAIVVGALVLELFLLAVGIMGLAFILFFVTCISGCTTSVFAAAYLAYKAANSTFKMSKDTRFRTPVWPFSPNIDATEPESNHNTSEADKKK